ncbi:hypothetical protein [Sporosarcina sp. NPDC096371]|uniref:hypothetical protein n=1 Tax=Sporosarcina sp. NPDC096371 TaxID=3364530 RepID=UPI003825CCA9
MEKQEGTHIRKLGLVLITLVMLAGCSENGIRIHNDSGEDAKKAEEVFMNDKRLTSAATVFHENDLVAVVSLKTFSRFKKEKIEKDLTKRMEELYPEMDVTVSADSKIRMEINKLVDSDNEKDISKKIEKLKSLLKEET